MKYLLILCMAALAAGPAAAQELDETFTAKLFTSKGTVEYLKAGSADWVAVKAPRLLEVGDSIRTGRKAKAEIYIRYGAKVRLGPDAHFVLTKVSPQDNSVEVLKGKLQAWVRKFAGRGFSVKTPSAVCAVRGTVFAVEVAPTGETVWDLFSGALQVADSSNRTVDLAPNQRLEVTPTGAAEAPVAIPESVKPPEEPAKIAEEKAETKIEQIIETKAKEAAETAKKEEVKEEAKTEAAEVVEPEPVEETAAVEPAAEPSTSVIPTQEAQESQEATTTEPVVETPVVSESMP